MTDRAEDAADATLSAYEAHAEQYADQTSTVISPLVDDLISQVDGGAFVLELGSGPGRDAAALEAAGLRVERTDGASAFVDRLTTDGHSARVLNVYEDDFGGPFDAVFANAVLLHVPRGRLAGVLRAARRSTVPGGVLVASFKKGDGEGWSHAKLDSPRYFIYWSEPALRSEFVASGWAPVEVSETTAPTSTERWISVIARNDTPHG